MTLSIGELARRSGVPATTLRYYEDVGVLPRPPREAGRRRYPEDVSDVLVIVGAAQEAGFTLAEIQLLLQAVGHRGPGQAWRSLAAGKQSELREKILRLEAMIELLDALSRCECQNLGECAERLRRDHKRHPG